MSSAPVNKYGTGGERGRDPTEHVGGDRERRVRVRSSKIERGRKKRKKSLMYSFFFSGSLPSFAGLGNEPRSLVSLRVRVCACLRVFK